MQDTVKLLEKHHGEGRAFMQLMKTHAPNRFDTAFWQIWTTWLEPVLRQPPAIADFGCGPGILLQYLRERYPQARLLGVEYAPYMLAELDSTQYEVVAHDLHQPNLPIADNCLDTVVSSHVLHEMTQPVCALQSIYRCLKVGGRCLLIDWIRGTLQEYLTQKFPEINIFAQDTSETVLNDIFSHFIEHNRYHATDLNWLLNGIGFKILKHEVLQEGHFGLWVIEKNA
jgi:SAM-dependent methyltransferase